MTKRLGRAAMVAVVGVVFGLGETKKDGKAMMKDDKMMQGDKPMEKKP